jgi:hypothetical protein
VRGRGDPDLRWCGRQCGGGRDLRHIQPLLPNGATPANLQFRYESTGLGFLGGPYVPMTSVSLQNLQHQFILPIGQLFAPWGGAGGSGAVPLGPLTAAMPGEDLNVGTGG